MNPSVIFQLSRGYQAKKLLSVRVTWQENPSCPESLLSPEPSAARASPSRQAIMPSTLSAVKLRCVSVVVVFFPWIVPLLCTVGYALQQAAIIHTKELFFFFLHPLRVRRSVDTACIGPFYQQRASQLYRAVRMINISKMMKLWNQFDLRLELWHRRWPLMHLYQPVAEETQPGH